MTAGPASKERGAALVICLLLVVLLLSMGVGLLALSETESLIAANDQWSEGAFQAAEAAVHVAIDQLGVGATSQVVPETAISGDFDFRSGGRTDSSPQPPEFRSITSQAGFSLAAGTGYNSAGYQFQIYRINGTGTGPRNAQREVEVEVELGPIK